MILKGLILKYGKDKINTLTKYPSILTLHKIGERGVLQEELTTDISDEVLYATEKIDGTNVRIICYGSEFLIGSRDSILHYCTDLYYSTDVGIVDAIYKLGIDKEIPITDKLIVIYGELFGGKIHSNSKNYGVEELGFRVFDIAVYNSLSILEFPIEKISHWREHETDAGLKYGQFFLTRNQIKEYFSEDELVSIIDFKLGDLSHEAILDNMNKALPKTTVALSETAKLKPEGLVLRNEWGSKRVKLRFEDYERTLKVKK